MSKNDDVRTCECLDCGNRFEEAWKLETCCPKCGRGFTLPLSPFQKVFGLSPDFRSVHWDKYNLHREGWNAALTSALERLKAAEMTVPANSQFSFGLLQAQTILAEMVQSE